MSRLVLLFALGCSDHTVKAFNADPEAQITSHDDGDEVSGGEALSLRGAVSDPDHSTSSLLAQWLVDGVVVCDAAPPDDDGVTTCEVEVDGELTEIEVTLEVRDPQDAAGAARVTLPVCGHIWYRDRDGDGFGDPEDTRAECAPPAGYIEAGGDCDDASEDVNPDADELCDDAVDNDCDGETDERCLGTNCFDDPDIIGDLTYYTTLGSLRDTDGTQGDGRYQDDYEFEAEAGAELAVHAWSETLDTTVQLYDPDCELYDEATDGARDSNAFLRFRIPDAGIWTVVVTTEGAGELGSYVIELLDDSAELGAVCALDTDTLDLLNPPYADIHEGVIDFGDQAWGSNVGVGFYFDDIEFYSFYGDTVTARHESTDFNPILNLYGPDCGLVTYDTDSGGGTTALISRRMERTGVYTLTPWGEYSYSQGDYRVEASATW
ncbi:MAG: pre-peptidase C-terminal domain-containing protein [Alphaproteobacteria bacterium]|nr:pre-peptidase C-terminal domain-containing protein [Alphaproteobacteria bacterium]